MEAAGKVLAWGAAMRAVLAVLFALFLSGCQNVIGPFQPRPRVRVDDPRLTIEEQERLGRARLALPDESPAIAPHSGAARPGLFADK